jgi:hypothetical protein
MMKFNVKDWLVFGGVSGVLSLLLAQVLARIPMIQLTFSTIAYNVRDQLLGTAGISGSLGTYLMSKLGQDLTVFGGVIAIVMGMLLVLAARMIMSFAPIIKNELAKLTAVFLIATVLEVLVVQGFGIPAMGALLGFVVGAVALAVVMKFGYQALGMRLPE